MRLLNIGIIHYPNALLSAVQGLCELFYFANKLCEQHNQETCFNTQIIATDQLSYPEAQAQYQVLILPPCLKESTYSPAIPDAALNDWLLSQHRHGAIISSVCAGAFLLAETGLLNGRTATTHWALADDFATRHPDVRLDINKILINDGDIITSGGLMSWVDLGLELVGQFTQPHIMRYLGKYLIVDTAPREQSYYQSFAPKLTHGDTAVLKAQHFLQANFQFPLLIKRLAEHAHLSERTLLRRFTKATGFKPNHYLQRLRIQKACDLIESTQHTFEHIANNVGYEDLSAFRKTFIKITGQTPKAFKNRFASPYPQPISILEPSIP